MQVAFLQSSTKSTHVEPFRRVIIIIERRDFGGIMSNDCKGTLQTQKQNSASATQQKKQSMY